jgi:signal transduction histidine kinase
MVCTEVICVALRVEMNLYGKSRAAPDALYPCVRALPDMVKVGSDPLIQTEVVQPGLKTRRSAGDEKRAALTRVVVVAFATISISLLQHLTPVSSAHWHYIYQRLFYLPVVYAALYFGWRGGVAAAAFAGFSYLPHVTTIWRDLPSFAVNQYLEIIVFCLVGVLTGVLADRERAQKCASQETAERLGKVYGELQDNFERMKRAERLYAIGQLSAGLAHEIRNPLSSIAGAAGILQRNRGCDPQVRRMPGYH